jgi:hypothetical protein
MDIQLLNMIKTTICIHTKSLWNHIKMMSLHNQLPSLFSQARKIRKEILNNNFLLIKLYNLKIYLQKQSFMKCNNRKIILVCKLHIKKMLIITIQIKIKYKKSKLKPFLQIQDIKLKTEMIRLIQ